MVLVYLRYFGIDVFEEYELTTDFYTARFPINENGYNGGSEFYVDSIKIYR